MDGASKFVRGDAIAGIIILAVNIFGGIVLGVTRHDMSLAAAANVFTKLSVGDGLVSQIPALVVSLAAGLLVSKGGTRGSADQAFFSQLGRYPRALLLAGILMGAMSLVPGLPFATLAMFSGVLIFASFAIPGQIARATAEAAAAAQRSRDTDAEAAGASVKDQLRAAVIELSIGRQLANAVMPSHEELAQRVTRIRLKFASSYGFVVPEIKLSSPLDLSPRRYQIRIHGAAAASAEIPADERLIIYGDGPKPDFPGTETVEPAYGLPAMWISPSYVEEASRSGFSPIDPASIVLTHLSETVRNNLAQLFSYRDMQALLEGLDPEYRKLLDEICPSVITRSGLQAVLKLLLNERVTIRNLNLILEAVSEIAPHSRRPEQIAEHVRIRLAAQICDELVVNGAIPVIRLGARWDQAFHERLKPDPRGGGTEFDVDPAMVEQFAREAVGVIRKHMTHGDRFALLTTPDARPYVRMIIERSFAMLPVLSNLEIARGIELRVLGSIS
ncbi:MAG: FHIPEP family type III secretion protein [Beijerinckiaceae bacterium]